MWQIQRKASQLEVFSMPQGFGCVPETYSNNLACPEMFPGLAEVCRESQHHFCQQPDQLVDWFKGLKKSNEETQQACFSTTKEIMMSAGRKLTFNTSARLTSQWVVVFICLSAPTILVFLFHVWKTFDLLHHSAQLSANLKQNLNCLNWNFVFIFLKPKLF